MADLSGKAAFVTGGGSGIGRACCIRLAYDGASVAVVDIRDDAAEETVRDIETRGGSAIAIGCDVTRSDLVEGAVADVVQAFGRLDVVCNCAGIFLAEGGVVDCSEQDWERVLAVNVKSIFLTGKHSVPELRRAGGGAIVNIASVYGLTALAGECAYDASKGAVVNLTRQMAIEFAKEKIRVNVICPSDCDTPLISALVPDGADPEEEKRRLGEAIPMGRIAQPDEVAAVAAFLASGDAAFMTGTVVPVDGGFLAQ